MTIAAAPPQTPGADDGEPPLPTTPAPASAPAPPPAHDTPNWLLAGVEDEERGADQHICRGID